MSKSFKIFLLVALSFLTSLNLSANATFSSIEKSSDRVEVLANAVDDVFTGLVDEIDGIIRISTKEGIEIARRSVNTITGTNGATYDVLQMTITTKETSVTGRQSVQQTIKYMDEVWEQPVEGVSCKLEKSGWFV